MNSSLREPIIKIMIMMIMIMMNDNDYNGDGDDDYLDNAAIIKDSTSLST